MFPILRWFQKAELDISQTVGSAFQILTKCQQKSDIYWRRDIFEGGSGLPGLPGPWWLQFCDFVGSLIPAIQISGLAHVMDGRCHSHPGLCSQAAPDILICD